VDGLWSHRRSLANKLYAMWLRHSIHRSTLADANEAHDRSE
jgi:hypothetical protein